MGQFIRKFGSVLKRGEMATKHPYIFFLLFMRWMKDRKGGRIIDKASIYKNSPLE